VFQLFRRAEYEAAEAVLRQRLSGGPRTGEIARLLLLLAQTLRFEERLADAFATLEEAQKIVGDQDLALGGSIKRVQQALRHASEMLLQPLEDWFLSAEAPRLVGIVPHGPLHGIPFHALPLEWSPRHPPTPLIMGTRVFYLPSIQTVTGWLDRSDVIGSESVVLVNSESSRRLIDEGVLVNALTDGRLLMDASATPESLKLWSRCGLLHIAARGRREGWAKLPALILQPPAFSMYRGVGWKDLERGIVGADYISRLNLNADLVVMSGCESDVSSLSEMGEGIDLLPRAFMLAGVRTVVSSSWRTPDWVTYKMMASFYSYLHSGHSVSSALAEAQRFMIRGTSSSPHSAGPHLAEDPDGKQVNLSHPYFWAGLSLIGDWRCRRH